MRIDTNKIIQFSEKIEHWIPITYPECIADGYEISDWGQVYSEKTDTILTPWINKNGYQMVSLATTIVDERTNKYKFKKYTIHSLVQNNFTNEFSKRKNPDYIVNHIDGNKLNCMSTNLEYITTGDNTREALSMGLIHTGEDCSYALVDNKTVHSVCRLLEEGKSYSYIIDYLELDDEPYTRSLLNRIKSGKHWKQISEQYNIDKSSRLRLQKDDFIDKVCKCIESNMSLDEMITMLQPTQDRVKFRKLVWFIKNRQCYKDISEKYTWWR